ncbi:MAG: DNA-3-methyladenine glycosylase I [Spirochaetales bacterium]|nr:DNA-3-methyladenine glycosylase I [Spirochaetales bacterium]
MLAKRDHGKERCPWCLGHDIYIEYHDKEWGVPVTDDRRLFEFLVLEGAQAGLSWLTILRRRDGYRRAFADFDVQKVARFSAKKVDSLLKDEGIIRNRLKVESAVANARAFIKVQQEFGSFSQYQWRFVDGRPRQNAFKTLRDVPARTDQSDAFSKDLKARGFSFVGSTIIYAHMQATGMVNDHLLSCPRHAVVGRMKLKERNK